MDVINVDELCNKLNSKREYKQQELNHCLAPQFDSQIGSFRMLISGRSGCGKTNVVISAILTGHVKFEHLFLIVRDASQSKYELLINWLKKLEDEYETKTGDRYSMYTVISDAEMIPSVDEFNSKCINLVIIDDMLMVKNQSKIEDIFIRGRHKNINICYLTQDYHQTSKIIRKQCEYFVIFGVSSKQELIQLSKDHSLEYNFSDFKQILQNATTPKTNFLLIDRRTEVDLLKIRKNWDMVLNNDLEFVHINNLL